MKRIGAVEEVSDSSNTTKGDGWGGGRLRYGATMRERRPSVCTGPMSAGRQPLDSARDQADFEIGCEQAKVGQFRGDRSIHG